MSHNGHNGHNSGRHAETGGEIASDLFSEFNHLKEEVVGFVDRLSSLITDAGKSLDEETAKTVEGVGEEVKDVMNLAIRSTKKKGSDLKGRVEENPWQLASAALAAGLIAGFYLSKRKG